MDSHHKLNSSDASLLSSLVEDSSIQENTLVDSYWGTTLPTLLFVVDICRFVAGHFERIFLTFILTPFPRVGS